MSSNKKYLLEYIIILTKYLSTARGKGNKGVGEGAETRDVRDTQQQGILRPSLPFLPSL